jgi:UDP-N-acetylmuramoyl-tripeptide--D-alanyl-D-alanine ligase
MKTRAVAEVARIVEGTIRGPGAEDTEVTGVVIDSREAGPGLLFVALPGEHADGHAYVSSAFEAGTTATMVRAGFDVPAHWAQRIIDVDDPGEALKALAKHERASTAARVIGITGSTGKTCTKDFTAAVLQLEFRAVKSPASFNNEVGLPLTILSAPEDAEAIVCEMGARGRGHIALLCDIARPEIGVLTNVGVAHMELFGSAEALREAKGELPASLPSDGTAVLNADDPVVMSYARQTPARVITYGLTTPADVQGRGVELDPTTGRARFELVAPSGRALVSLPVPGEHMVPNALAAAATGVSMGLSVEQCATGLAGAEMSSGRMEVFESADGIRVVNDAYNANPTSLAAALRAARWMAGTGRCIAVLGHMAELGPISAAEHERAGELVARLGIDLLVVVGREADLIAVGAAREGVEPERILRSEGPDEALHVIRSVARPGDLVLIKASRVARLDRLAEALHDLPSDSDPGAVAVTGGAGG